MPSCAIMRRMAAASSSTMMGARPSSGSSSSSSAGLVISARAIASICCSPPESWLPMLPRRSASRGKSSIDGRQVPAAGARRDGEVLLHRQRREDLALLRHPAEAQLGAPVRRQARVMSAPRQTAPRITCVQPMMESRSVVLPTPLRPRTARLPCSGHLQRDVVEHHRLAVAGAQAFQREQGSAMLAPRRDRPRARAGRPRSPAACPPAGCRPPPSR